MPAIDQRLRELGIVLPEPSVPRFNYIPFTVSGKTVYVAGQVPMQDGKPAFIGKLGQNTSVEQGYDAARLCALAIIAHVKTACGGDLDRVARFLRVGGFVNSTPDFVDAPKCINGASDVIVQIFGEAGKHARTAVSVASLPMGVAVEVEAIVELK
jgi:enamine deaminase RidA (YjgF/YER057c/UK114 family)